VDYPGVISSVVFTPYCNMDCWYCHNRHILADNGLNLVEQEDVFDYLEKIKPGVGGEIQLTDAIAASLDQVPTFAHRFEGTRFDCGSKQGFIDATVHFARKRGFKIN